MPYYDEPLIAALGELPYGRLDNLFTLQHAVWFAARAQQGCLAKTGLIPDNVRAATLAVAVLVALFSEGLHVDDDGYVVIWADSSVRPEYRMRLATDVGLRTVVRHQLSRTILNDDDGRYDGLAPGEDMTFPRFRAAHLGLLEQLRIWAEELIHTGQCNHGEGINDDVLAPEDLLHHIRALTEETNNLLLVREVMCA